jgi:hypothetical protein
MKRKEFITVSSKVLAISGLSHFAFLGRPASGKLPLPPGCTKGKDLCQPSATPPAPDKCPGGGDKDDECGDSTDPDSCPGEAPPYDVCPTGSRSEDLCQAEVVGADKCDESYSTNTDQCESGAASADQCVNYHHPDDQCPTGKTPILNPDDNCPPNGNDITHGDNCPGGGDEVDTCKRPPGGKEGGDVCSKGGTARIPIVGDSNEDDCRLPPETPSDVCRIAPADDDSCSDSKDTGDGHGSTDLCIPSFGGILASDSCHDGFEENDKCVSRDDSNGRNDVCPGGTVEIGDKVVDLCNEVSDDYCFGGKENSDECKPDVGDKDECPGCGAQSDRCLQTAGDSDECTYESGCAGGDQSTGVDKDVCEPLSFLKGLDGCNMGTPDCPE